MIKNLGKIIGVLLILSVFASCGDFNKLVKSKDMEKKYYAAKNYYEKGDCVKALQLLEELVAVYRNSAKAESIYYYYAYANYCTQDYILAAYHFKNFARNYPNSGHAEECLFMGAYCFSLESPRYSLDQSDTKSAIKEMQLFINKYPNSPLVDSCNHIIDRLRLKLERKTFEIAKQYYDIEDYKGAMIAFQNMIKDYPDTRYREEALFYNLKASYRYAYHSIETKKLERLNNTIDYYNKFIATFPQSRYMRDAENIFNNAQRLRGKLAYEVPQSLYDKGYYADCIEVSNMSLAEFPDHPKKQQVEYLLLQSTYSLADLAQGYNKEKKLNSVVAVYDRVKSSITDPKLSKNAQRIHDAAQSKLNELPYALPLYFYDHLDWANAYSTAKKTLAQYPDHPRKDKLAEILVISGMNRALDDWIDRKRSLGEVIKDKEAYGALVSKKKPVQFVNCTIAA